MGWTTGNRIDNLVLDENTGVISAHFRGNMKTVIKSSDGVTEYLNDRFAKHLPQNEGPP